GTVVSRRGGGVHCSNGAAPFFERVRFEDNVASHGGAVWSGWEGGARFDDCEFVRNRSVGSGATGFGGAVYLSGSGAFTRCRFFENESEENGAALLQSGSGPVLVTDCHFESNGSGGAGGAVGLFGGRATVTGCRFLRNASTGGGRGGAVHATDLVARECVFRDNVAGEGGGAVAVHTDRGEITDCRFEGNEARRGGAVLAYADAGLWVEGCHFRGNVATGNAIVADHGGGAICLADFHPATIRSSSFVENEATHRGGAVLLGTRGVEMEACSFVGNRASAGSALWVPLELVGATEVRRCILAGGRGSAAILGSPGAAAAVACSDLWGNEGGPGSLFTDGGGNFSADPRFCSPVTGDYRLQWGSPCLPENSQGCGLVGRFGFGGCASIAVRSESWGALKSRYR
ncbi:MAG TPA: right-handed parallel beta-helix repeat-containing protein, partial [bacterium]|nr:right-handed parallel beta-helix repeat-containing protein [bacterium]